MVGGLEMKIITLTLNPAFDVHCFCDNFKPYHESIAKITSKEAGGKGVNISRALQVNDVENNALVIVGKENGEEFCKTLEKEGLTVGAVWTNGRIRENITLHESQNRETRISFDGFICEESILTQVNEKIGAVDEHTIVAFTGSIPKGVTSANVLSLLQNLKIRGAKLVIDSRSISLDDLVLFKPWLIKPNKDEAEFYMGKSMQTFDEVVQMAQELHEKGVENAMISLGGDGAVLACDKGVFYAKTPKITVKSTIGAGDSMIAGFIVGTVKSLSIENVLKRAVAYGTAACQQEGTLPPLPCEIQKIEKDVKVVRLV